MQHPFPVYMLKLYNLKWVTIYLQSDTLLGGSPIGNWLAIYYSLKILEEIIFITLILFY